MLTRLRMERQKRNWTLAYAAEQLDITEASLSRIERREINPSYVTQQRIKKLFNKPIDYLLQQTDDQTA